MGQYHRWQNLPAAMMLIPRYIFLLSLCTSAQAELAPWQQYERYSDEPEWQGWVDAQLEAPEAEQGLYGEQLLPLGDVNGDGYQDIAVSAPGQEGASYIYFGSDDGLPAQASQRLSMPWDSFASRAAAVGDVNNDGYADMLISAPEHALQEGVEGVVQLYLGSSLGLQASRQLSQGQVREFGSSLSAAGDINHDGYADVAIASGQCADLNSNRAQVWLYFGSAEGLSALPFQTLDFEHCAGTEMAQRMAAADFNGDGFSDLWLAAPKYTGTHIAQGQLQLFLGSEQGLQQPAALFINGKKSLDRLGFSLSASLDINADGYADMLLTGQNGESVMYMGNAEAEVQPGQSYRAKKAAEGEVSRSFFAWSHSTLADHNADGYPDWFIGNPGLQGRYSSALQFQRGTASDAMAERLSVPRTELGFAHQVLNVDVNRDGLSDALVSAPEQKKIYLHYGHPRELLNELEARQQWLDETVGQSLQFGYGTQGTGERGQQALAQLAELLQAEPQWQLHITGHSCDLGSERQKQQISQHRSSVVRQWMRHLGIAADRLRVDSVGDRDMGNKDAIELVDSKQEKEQLRQLNRRVSLRLAL